MMVVVSSKSFPDRASLSTSMISKIIMLGYKAGHGRASDPRRAFLFLPCCATLYVQKRHFHSQIICSEIKLISKESSTPTRGGRHHSLDSGGWRQCLHEICMHLSYDVAPGRYRSRKSLSSEGHIIKSVRDRRTGCACPTQTTASTQSRPKVKKVYCSPLPLWNMGNFLKLKSRRKDKKSAK
ncbi:hypothetical protein THAOC_21562 [Thalassiosira oceanica]|uniref:Uncharacterized protein n=1 Tax=Thalassiosira oceanica TaxID=159749 RepID=K0SBM4_THAOC|nr:hypothetical protein THAOC_21562 [Thalassiosira oceanica]|eukprot:EJK58326.1 hypothetical protein THAOC_21562 [Thalassiosira oceanica]